MGRAPDLYFVGPRFKSSTLLLTRFVLGCTLYIFNIVIKIAIFCNVNAQFVSMDKKSHFVDYPMQKSHYLLLLLFLNIKVSY